MNKRGLKRMFSLLCIFLVIMLPVSFAVSISNLQVEDSGTDAAFVKWTTEVPATSEVKYKRGNFLTTARGQGVTTNHNVVLSNLVFGTSYPFTATSCSSPTNCISESSEFVAGGGGVVTSSSSSNDPLNIDIPPTVNVRALDIIGSTRPFATVELYVNDLSLPARVLNPVDTGASGRIAFRGILLDEQNTLKLVAIDQNGARFEKTFQVAVDIFFPVVTIEDLPSFVHEKELKIKGVVSEAVTVKVFVSHEEEVTGEATEPTQVQNLRVKKVEKNFIDLEWDKVRDNDFSHYIIYRGGIGPIATLSPSSNNKYTDVRVDSGASYTYTVAYMNTFGKIGDESSPLRVDTLPGGFVTGIRPVRIDPNLDSTTPKAQQNVQAGSFTIPVTLSKEGKYTVKIEVSDSGGNRETFLRSVTLDTKPPEIKIISPPPGSTIFENFAEDMDIEGETDPGARVHLFIGRTPFNMDNLSFDLTNLKRDISSIPEEELDADCRPEFSGHNICPTGADYSLTADASGKFEFTNVDASSAFSGIVETSIATFSSETTKSTREAKLLLVAEDKSGLRAVKELRLRIGTCWSGNLSWDIIPLQEFQSPSFLSAERLSEGTESIYFYFNYSYVGPGDSAAIKSVSLTKACGEEELLEDRYQIGCDMIGGSGRTIRLNQEGTVSYSTVKLKRVKGMENWFEEDWKSFFESINNEVTFPFRVLINYEHDVSGKTNKESQATCQEVTYVVDNSRIDPREVLPDWLLYDFVEFLDGSIEDIAAIQESLNSLVQLASVGCFASFAANFIVQFWRRFTIFTWETKTKLENFWDDDAGIASWLGISTSSSTPEESAREDYCKELVKAINDDPKSYPGGFKMKYLSDRDLKECFPEVESIWDAEYKTYQALRWTCDRLFGHTTPSRWTELKTDEELKQQVESGKTCDTGEDVQGQPLRPIPCERVTGFLAPKAKEHKGETCFTAHTTNEKGQRKQTLYVLKKEAVLGNNIATMQTSDGRGGYTGEDFYAVKVNEGNYLTARSDDCQTVCGVKSNKKGTTAEVVGDKVVVTGRGDRKGSKKVTGGCMKASECIQTSKEVQAGTKKVTVDYTGGTFDALSVFRRGYTSDCFYEDGKSVDVVSSNQELREECCCFTGEDVKPEVAYYSIDDQDIGPTVRALKQGKGDEFIKVHKEADTTLSTSEGEHIPLEFSYRYFKNKFRVLATEESSGFHPREAHLLNRQEELNEGLLHTAYNPNRYIDGRDFPACFGQDNWFYDTFRGEKSLLIIDPLQQWHSAFQCANLGGVQQRLTQLSNAMRLMSNCLKSVRVSGEGNTGACKELFTQYVCQFFWDAIQFLTDDCNPLFGQLVGDIGEDETIDVLRGGFSSFFEAGTDLQSTVNDEYSNAKLNEMFGTGQEAIARKVCLAAFGYDWDITPQALVDASYTQPFSSLVQALSASREYLTIDPQKSQSKFEYRSSWVINPGCDIRGYDIKLACIDRDTLNTGKGADCTEQSSPDGVNCPCLDSGQKERTFVTKSKTIKQNAIIDEAESKIITSPYKYDHLKITLRPERRAGQTTISNELLSKCFPQGYEDGIFYFPIRDRTAQDILQCQLEPLSGVYGCRGGLEFFEGKGSGFIESVKIDGETARDNLEFSPGKKLEIITSVQNTGGDKCLRMKMTGQADQFLPVFGEGAFPYTFTSRELQGSGTSTSFTNSEPNNIFASLDGTQTNTETITFSLSFEDDNRGVNGDREFSVINDEIKVNGFFIPKTLVGGNPAVDTQELQKYNERASVQNGQDPKITVKDDSTLILEQRGARIAVTGVNYLHTQTNIHRGTIAGTLSVPRPSSITSPTRTAQVELGLYHTKEDSSSSGSDADRCNFNSLVTHSGVTQKRTYTIKVV